MENFGSERGCRRDHIPRTRHEKIVVTEKENDLKTREGEGARNRKRGKQDSYVGLSGHHVALRLAAMSCVVGSRASRFGAAFRR